MLTSERLRDQVSSEVRVATFLSEIQGDARMMLDLQSRSRNE